MRARDAVVRRRPPREAPVTVADLPEVRSYPDGFCVAALGT
jgi:hypothetical protein